MLRTNRKVISIVPADASTTIGTLRRDYSQAVCWNCQRTVLRRKRRGREAKYHYCSMDCWNDAKVKQRHTRLWAKVRQEGDCWIWHGHVSSNGYGSLRVGARWVGVHRYVYILTRGPLPDGLVIDHLCRQPRCVNPAHLEPVPHRINVLRGESFSAVYARRMHCKHGHVYTSENTRIDPTTGGRRCRVCENRRAAEHYARKKRHDA